MALPWASSLDVSYVGQHGFNLLQNVDINSIDFGAAFTGAAQDPTLAAELDARRDGATTDLLRPYRGGPDQPQTGAELEHVPLDPDVVQPAVPRRLLGGLNWT